jgi:hypothetical protein
VRSSRIRELTKLECSRDNRFDLSDRGYGRFRASLLPARRKSDVAARSRCLGGRRHSDGVGHDLGVQAAALRQPAPRLPETSRRPREPGRPTRTAIVHRRRRQPAGLRFALRICGAPRICLSERGGPSDIHRLEDQRRQAFLRARRIGDADEKCALPSRLDNQFRPSGRRRLCEGLRWDPRSVDRVSGETLSTKDVGQSRSKLTATSDRAGSRTPRTNCANRTRNSERC